MNKQKIAVLFLLSLFPLLSCKKNEVTPEEIRETLRSQTLGLAYLEENLLNEARAQYEKIIQLAPEEPLGYANLSLVYLRDGKYAEAEKQIREALKRSDDPDVRLILSEIEEKAGRTDTAQQTLEATIKKSPDHIRSLYRLSQMLIRSRDDRRIVVAETYLTKVVERMPSHLPARLMLVEVLLRSGKTADAIRHLEAIRQQIPDLPAGSAEFIQQALTMANNNNPQQALIPAIGFHNFLKPIPFYQASIIEMIGPGGSMIGFPILHFSDRIMERVKTSDMVPEGIRFSDVTSQVGLRGGTAFAFADYDLDGDTDLFLTGKNALLRNDRGRYTDVTAAAKVEGQSTWGAFADYDNDADPDLFLFQSGAIRIMQNQGNGKFSDSSTTGLQSAESPLSAILFDFDQEGDLDLFVSGIGRSAAFRNNSDGSFTDIAAEMNLTPAYRSGDLALADFDEDGDLDLLLANQDATVKLFDNLRQGQFRDIALEVGLGGETKVVAAAAADYDNNGFSDLVLCSSVCVLYSNENGKFRKADPSLPSFSAADVLFFDFDNDGYLDLLGASSNKLILLRNQVGKGWKDHSSIFSALQASTISTDDFDLDGDLDIFAASAAGKVTLLRNEGGNANRWLKIKLAGLGTGSGKNNRQGIGAKLEVKAGDRYQMRTATGPVTHFGLGATTKADVVRIVWTNGVPQNHFEPGTNQTVVETQILKGSCAFLYAWNGHQYSFVTDIMWKSALGMPLGIMGGQTAYAFADSTKEYLRIPGRSLQAKDGVYSLQITEELWETSYMDQMKLIAVDHPAGIDIFVDEKFVTPPYPSFQLYPVSKKHAPVAGIDEDGNDVLNRLLRQDDDYVSDLTPAKYQGSTRVHDLVLDLGKWSTKNRIILFLNGWLFPGDASINVATSQSKTYNAVAPYLQVRNKRGEWQTVIPNMSFPMGKNKTVVVDLADKFLADDHRIRISTSMEIYWDHIFFSVDEPPAKITRTVLPASSADLHYRGFSRVYRKGLHGPHWFDYSSVTTAAQWRDLEGYYTRFGDVTPLLQQSDDEYVILNAGDEMTVHFDATRAPSLPQGWSRDFLIYTDGWIKDGDLNTAHSKTVDPLPFHAMKSYPYDGKQSYPNDERHQRFLRTYNTRLITTEPFRTWNLPQRLGAALGRNPISDFGFHISD